MLRDGDLPSQIAIRTRAIPGMNCRRQLWVVGAATVALIRRADEDGGLREMPAVLRQRRACSFELFPPRPWVRRLPGLPRCNAPSHCWRRTDRHAGWEW